MARSGGAHPPLSVAARHLGAATTIPRIFFIFQIRVPPRIANYGATSIHLCLCAPVCVVAARQGDNNEIICQIFVFIFVAYCCQPRDESDGPEHHRPRPVRDRAIWQTQTDTVLIRDDGVVAAAITTQQRKNAFRRSPLTHTRVAILPKKIRWTRLHLEN